MFHDLLIWTGVLACYWFAMRRRSLLAKVLILSIAVVATFTVQGIKQSYRARVWTGEKASITEEISRFWSFTWNSDRDSVLENAMSRLNQGWIVSHVIAQVPEIQPYAEGDTIEDAVIAAVVPRFLYEEKGKAGGRSNFIRFTGLPLNDTTAMTISLLGEGYANFGVEGGITFMLLIGLAIGGGYLLALRVTHRHPLFLFWIPLIFYQAIKAETDLTEILNHVVKGGVVAVVGFHLLEIYIPTHRLLKPPMRKRKKSHSPAACEMEGVNLDAIGPRHED